ncbi:hypothetical protein [Kitasatospora sp. NPDC050463]|uniref:hypothetical protein n=1 Tax=Kitasatospora sp. NPDC050463 TaxID=3155786 RepID=UPI0033D2C3E6
MSVAKLPYEHAEDSISLTNTVAPDARGRTEADRITNLVGVLDGTNSACTPRWTPPASSAPAPPTR